MLRNEPACHPALSPTSQTYRIALTIRCAHVLHDVSLATGGPAALVRNLSTHFWRSGHEVRIIACRMDSDAENPNVIRLESGSRIPRALSRAALDQVLDLVSSYAVVHLHGPWAALNIQLANVLRREGKPYVLTMHGNLGQWALAQKPLRKRVWLAAFGRPLFEGAQALHFTSQKERREALRQVPWAERNARVIPCMLDTGPFNNPESRPSVFEAIPSLRPQARRILFLGRVHPTKGPDVLIRALAELLKGNMDVQLVLAGPGPASYRRQLEKLSRTLGVAQNVLFSGPVTGPLKVALLQWAQAMALPTHQESFGLALVESLAAGTPVVTTPGVAIAERLRTNAGAIIVRRRPEDFATALRSLLSDPQHADRQGLLGKRYVNEWLDMDLVGSAYEEMYRAAIEACAA